MQKEDVLRDIAKRLRIFSLQMTSKAGSGHPSTCLSSADIAACLFFDEMRFNVKNVNDLGNDEFILSKGHASALLYAVYAEAGVIPIEKLDSYRVFGSFLEGHPTPNFPWAKIATGSLGQGLSAGVGLALANRMRGLPGRVFVLMGDGECAEGSVWEAVALGKSLDLSNIVAVVDCNRLGQSGESLHGRDISKWKAKFAGFGWNVFVIDGHNIKDIQNALSMARNSHGPSVVLAKTIKGKGVSFIEDKNGWHGKALSISELERALNELGPLPSVDSKKFISMSPKTKVSNFVVKSPASPKYKLGDSVSTREAFGVMLEKLGVDERVVVFDGDVKNSTFSERFKSFYPERFVDCFIAEQNMVGMALGSSIRGFVPFACTFGAFFSRAHDQIRMSAISRANLKFVGSHVGVSIGGDGPSQMGLEDLALFRCLPNSVVLYPCDAVSSERCTELLTKFNGVGYLRTSRPKTNVIYNNSERFSVGGCKLVRRSFRDSVVVIAAGVTVHEAIKAADLLKSEKVFVRVIDAYSVKPLDARSILSSVKGRKVIVVEDHYAEGGLGEAVAGLGVPIKHLCIRDIPRSGSSEDLMRVYGIDSASIVKAVRKL